ncbi:MAG: hypothetical protein GX417_00170 [Clostridiales bacterium]|nr:hypothetical protein [Clostridiales bacterium]
MDGSEQTQITHDTEWNNWFPHISPNGKKVVFLSYHKGDTTPDAHPADKNVEIRIMDQNGENLRSIIRLFGGQGTLNVNSWAPDSDTFAFVSYQYRDDLQP